MRLAASVYKQVLCICLTVNMCLSNHMYLIISIYGIVSWQGKQMLVAIHHDSIAMHSLSMYQLLHG